MIIGAKSDVGKIRTINEDDYYISNMKDFKLYLVADGMGGHNAGEVASKMAKETIVDYMFKNRDRLKKPREIVKVIKEAIEESNTMIYLKSKTRENCEGMGTTVTLAYIYEGYVYIGHIGDSRAYVLDGSGIRQVTEDHSFVDELIKSGDITKEEAKSHPKRNLITRAVGSSSIIEVAIYRLKIESQDILLLLSDGVINHIDEKELYEMVKKEEDMQLACDKIVKKANELGGEDNITIIAIDLDNEVKI